MTGEGERPSVPRRAPPPPFACSNESSGQGQLEESLNDTGRPPLRRYCLLACSRHGAEAAAAAAAAHTLTHGRALPLSSSRPQPQPRRSCRSRSRRKCSSREDLHKLSTARSTFLPPPELCYVSLSADGRSGREFDPIPHRPVLSLPPPSVFSVFRLLHNSN